MTEDIRDMLASNKLEINSTRISADFKTITIRQLLALQKFLLESYFIIKLLPFQFEDPKLLVTAKIMDLGATRNLIFDNP